MDWLTDNKIPLGRWLDQLMGLVDRHLGWLLGIISDVLRGPIEGLIDLMQWLHPLVLVALIAAVAWWLHRSWKLVVLTTISLLLIINLGYWDYTVATLALVVFATLICMAVGVPIGIAAAHRPWLYTAIRPILDLMQTIPPFVYLIPALALFGLGVVPGILATVIFVLPAPVRLTYLGVSSVPQQLLDAGEAFGATKRQLLWKVELPYATPAIMQGLTQCFMLSLSMVVIAALVGAEALGTAVVRALMTMNAPMGFESGLAIVILAIVLDRVCKQPGKRPTRY